ncbi:hypothetical protein [Actinopolyspora alba]|nr:hypothetical protein [Actinopolyspora alba]
MKENWLFVVSLAGMTVSAAALMLLIPSLFDSGEQGNFRGIGVLACLAVVFAVGMLYWRPSPSSSDNG